MSSPSQTNKKRKLSEHTDEDNGNLWSSAEDNADSDDAVDDDALVGIPESAQSSSHKQNQVCPREIVTSMPLPNDSERTSIASESTSMHQILNNVMGLSVETVRAAMILLINLCSKRCGKEKENRLEFGRIGGPFVIVKAMDRYAYDADLLASGCAVLCALAKDSDANKEIIAEVGGVLAVVKAMQKFPGHHFLQECGCGTSRNLIIANKGRQLFMEANGVATIISAMKRHQKEEALQEYACSVLYNLSLSGDEMRCAIVCDGGMSALTEAVEAHYLSHSAVKKIAVETLKILLDSI